MRGDGFTDEMMGARKEALEFPGIITFLTALPACLGQTAGTVRFHRTGRTDPLFLRRVRARRKEHQPPCSPAAA